MESHHLCHRIQLHQGSVIPSITFVTFCWIPWATAHLPHSKGKAPPEQACQNPAYHHRHLKHRLASGTWWVIRCLSSGGLRIPPSSQDEPIFLVTSHYPWDGPSHVSPSPEQHWASSMLDDDLVPHNHQGCPCVTYQGPYCLWHGSNGSVSSDLRR